MKRIVIAGGGICGLTGAMMLADDGHDVVVLERDPAPPPGSPDEAFEWQRHGVAQFGLGHWMQARGTSILRDAAPSAMALLRDNGGFEFNLASFLLSLQGETPTDDDARFDLLTGRRSTIEWALATAAADHPGIKVRRGVAIDGLVADHTGGVPHVTGLRLADGQVIDADLVVDATGRRSPTPRWLEDIGAAAPVETGEDSGFAYYGRYYRSDDGATPAMVAPLLTPVGSFSVLTLPADNGTWSLTLYGMADDAPLRRFRDEDVFDRVVSELPLHAHWLDGEPLTEIKSMAGGVDRERAFVVDGMPCATGLLSVADAVACTNPSLGRGMTLGLMHMEMLRESIRDHASDPMALALEFHERTQAELKPYHEATTTTDRRRVNAMRLARDGETPTLTPEEQIAETMLAHASSDPVMTRAVAQIIGCTALPDEVIGQPGVLERAMELAAGPALEPAPGPDRPQLLELIG